MDLADIDPAMVGTGPMSNVSYDSHVVTRKRMVDELPRVKQDNQPDSYNAHLMDAEIQRVSRELYKAFSGMNSGFAEVLFFFSIEKINTYEGSDLCLLLKDVGSFFSLC